MQSLPFAFRSIFNLPQTECTPRAQGLGHSPVVGYSGPPNPLKGLFMIDNAEKAKGSIPGGLGLEGLFLRNHTCRKSLIGSGGADTSSL